MLKKREAVVTHNGKILASFTTVRQAENYIATQCQPRDPQGVHAGNYGIDASPRAEAEYQRLRSK